MRVRKWTAFLVFALAGCGYNRIVNEEQQVEAAWSQVESQLQRRADLIPNLVEVVKGYAKHEKGVFDDIANARAAMLGASIQAPLTGLVLVVELTHSGLSLLVPIMAATFLATAVARQIDGYSIYSARLPAASDGVGAD